MPKNEHIIWAYGDLAEGPGQLLIIGITDEGLDFLKKEKKTLVIKSPGTAFLNVSQVVVFHEVDKATLKARLREANIQIEEMN